MNLQTNQLFSLAGKTAVVTGGTGVLGQAMVKGLSAAGASVVILGRRKDAAEDIAKALRAAGGKALGVGADVLQRDQLDAAYEHVIKEFGTLDILVNAAGGNMAGAVIAPDKNFFDLDIDAFQQVVDLNLLGTVLPSQVFSKDMAARRSGVVINIASMASFRPITRVVGYSAAKAGIDNFTQWLAVEMARKFGEGLRVNAISPGFFITEQNRTLLTNSDGTYTARGQAAINQTPFGRFGRPEELVGTLVWLCSDAAAFVTGVNIPVDGGFNAFCGV
ncbi:SDR family oxidoreductase [Parachryseolinea silvisoli]|jgi:NAD(P)-dependent dehydrogenase (short-subunit alcohol dehydrogenase family)|uniref:SDR family oxidoreductase n=1 Tax=Parachryseolinea silvisoli TaxID=2873601 RepID=UPI0022658A02|nr:SDR family oxidoreductase [Parachryseolinea silvisoli]MCD9015667.1 SDR family oxidoreductase [Parachryseolinea silvisoli]